MQPFVPFGTQRTIRLLPASGTAADGGRRWFLDPDCFVHHPEVPNVRVWVSAQHGVHIDVPVPEGTAADSDLILGTLELLRQVKGFRDTYYVRFFHEDTLVQEETVE